VGEKGAKRARCGLPLGPTVVAALLWRRRLAHKQIEPPDELAVASMAHGISLAAAEGRGRRRLGDASIVISNS